MHRPASGGTGKRAVKKLLIGVSAAALPLAILTAAPALINWNDYRAELARRVGDAVGRPVAFDGDLGLRLLPAPAFTAENVKVKAPPGFSQADMVAVERLEVRVALAPLLSGRIQVESILAAAPRATVESDAQGRVNWRAGGGERNAAAGAGTGGMGPLAQLLSFDQIVVEKGRLEIIDARSGVRETLEAVDLRIVAGSLTGPFQASGGVTWRGAPVRLEATTGRFADAAAAPVRLAVTLPGGDPERLSGVRFAGIISPNGPDPLVQGEIRIEGPNLHAAAAPAARASGSTILAAAPAAPFSFRASLEAGGDKIRLDNLDAAVGETRASGSAALTLGEISDLAVALLIGRLDLGSWVAATGADDDKTLRRPAPAPTVAAGGLNAGAVAEAWPSSLRARLDLTIDAVVLAAPVPPPAASAANGRESGAGRPINGKDGGGGNGGGSSAGGRPSNGQADSAAAGGSAATGAGLRQARLTALIDKNGATVERLSATGPGGAALAAAGGIAFTPGGGAEADMRFDVKADNLRPLLALLRADATGAADDRLRRFAAAGRIRGDATRLDVNDVEATIDGAALSGALSAGLRDRLSIGLRLEADKLNLDAYAPLFAAPPAAADAGGTAATDVARAAAKPRAAGENGAAAGASLAAWDEAAARLVGRGDVAADLRIGEATIGGRLWRNLHVDATAAGGGLDVRTAAAETAGVELRLSGQAQRFAPLSGAHAALEAKTDDAAAAARTLGESGLLDAETVAATPSGPAALSVRLAGDRDKLAVEAAVQAAGADLEIGGETVKPQALLTGDGGRFDLSARLKHPDADALFRLLGRPGAPAAPGSFDVFARVSGDRSRMTIGDVKGVIGGAPAAGSGRFDGRGVRPRVEADLQIGMLDFTRFDAAPAAGAPAGPASSTDAENDRLGLLRRFDGQFAVTAAGLRAGGAVLTDVAAKLHLTNGVLSADRFDAGYMGGRIGGSATLAAADAGTGRRSRFTAAVTAEALKPDAASFPGATALTGGVADAEADVTIFDPAAPEPLRRLEGSARASARGGVLHGVDMARLRDRLHQVDRPQAAVEGVLRGLQGGETPVTTLDVGVRIDGGVLETTDGRLETPAGSVGLVGRVDAANRKLDLLATIEPNVDPPVPPLALRLSGSLDAPTKTLDLGALQRHLQERLSGAKP